MTRCSSIHCLHHRVWGEAEANPSGLQARGGLSKMCPLKISKVTDRARYWHRFPNLTQFNSDSKANNLIKSDMI